MPGLEDEGGLESVRERPLIAVDMLMGRCGVPVSDLTTDLLREDLQEARVDLAERIMLMADSG